MSNFQRVKWTKVYRQNWFLSSKVLTKIIQLQSADTMARKAVGSFIEIVNRNKWETNALEIYQCVVLIKNKVPSKVVIRVQRIIVSYWTWYFRVELFYSIGHIRVRVETLVLDVFKEVKPSVNCFCFFTIAIYYIRDLFYIWSNTFSISYSFMHYVSKPLYN